MEYDLVIFLQMLDAKIDENTRLLNEIAGREKERKRIKKNKGSEEVVNTAEEETEAKQ